MESILKMMGVDSEEIMSQATELVNIVQQMCKMTEENQEMLRFLVQNVPIGTDEYQIEQQMQLAKRLAEIEKKYEKTDKE